MRIPDNPEDYVEGNVNIRFVGLDVELPYDEVPETELEDWEKEGLDEIQMEDRRYRRGLRQAGWDTQDTEEFTVRSGNWVLTEDEYLDEVRDEASPLGASGLPKKPGRSPVSSAGMPTEAAVLDSSDYDLSSWEPIYLELKEDAQKILDEHDFAILLESEEGTASSYDEGNEIKAGEPYMAVYGAFNGLRKRNAAIVGRKLLED